MKGRNGMTASLTPVTVDIMTTTFTNSFPSKNKTEKFTERMAKKTKLSETEIDRLVQIFKRITVRHWMLFSHLN